MRVAAALLLLAGLAPAQEPLIKTFGKSMEDFFVRAAPEGLERDTPEALAESYARYLVAQRNSITALGSRFRAAHVLVLGRYFTKDAVQRQQASYAAIPVPTLKCRVAGVKDGQATLLREWTGVRGNPVQTMRLVLQQGDGGWHIVRILHVDSEGKAVDAGLGVPPAAAEEKVPREAGIDRSSAQATVRSLGSDMLRLGALRKRAQARLDAAYVALLNELLGAEAVKKARTKAKSREPLGFELSMPGDPIHGVVRLGVVATEAVPGEKDQRSAVGQAAFDLRKDGDSWRILAEWIRRDPKKPLVKRESHFGLFFLG